MKMIINLLIVAAFIFGLFTHGIKGGCTSGKLRLGGSIGSDSGRPEMCDNEGTWHEVCGWSFDCKEAQVVCRQAGFSAAVSESTEFANPTKDTPYGLYDCTGSESSLLDCPPDSFWATRFSGCDTWRVNVKCTSSIANEQCSVENSVRLVNGPSDAEGQLQICKNNVWNEVCSTWLTYYLDKLASTVCKQLGYTVKEWPKSPYISALAKGHYANTTSLEYRKSVRVSCNSWGTTYDHISQCSMEDDCVSCSGAQVSVQCDKTITDCVNGTVRLTGGDTTYRGYVEICKDGIWGKISNNVEGKNTPGLLCSAMGLSSQGSRIALWYRDFDHSHNPIIAKSISCCSRDSKLETCVIEYTAEPITQSGYNLLEIECTDGCTDGQVRIGEKGGSEGLVEMCKRRVWTLIEAYNWDDTDAGVVCKSLGYSSGKAASSSDFIKPKRFTEYTDFRCTGNESSLKSCTHGHYYSWNSKVETKAAVKCTE